MKGRGFAAMVFATAAFLSVFVGPSLAESPDFLSHTPVMTALEAELSRSLKNLKLEDYQPPYFISYLVEDTYYYSVDAEYGSIKRPNEKRYRYVYPEVRVGSYKLDNTKYRGDDDDDNEDDGDTSYKGRYLPSDGDVFALRRALWLLTDKVYKASAADFLKNKAALASGVRSDAALDDFSREKKVVFYGPPANYPADKDKINARARSLSAEFAGQAHIHTSQVKFWNARVRSHYANSEGTRLVYDYSRASAGIMAACIGGDGSRLAASKYFYAETPGGLPSDEELKKEISGISERLKDLMAANDGEPMTAPAILDPESSATLFHEAVGHRLEGERQRDEKEGQTFKNKIGEKICPDFISVADDPTLKEYRGTFLNGYYLFDDEGVPAVRVVLVDDGTLKNFLLSRRPVKGFDKSNGHGRAITGKKPAARMGNLLVSSKKELSRDELKTALTDLCKVRGKPYGLIIKGMRSGDTSTRRKGRQSFRVTPDMVYLVDAATGEETLIRNVEVVGTPLASVNKITATGNDYAVSNGYCSADSGSIPVSHIAPSLLLEEIELQRKNVKKTRKPILPTPEKR